MQLWAFIKWLPKLIVNGIKLWVDPPRRYDLRLDENGEERCRQRGGRLEEFHPQFCGGDETAACRLPTLKFIHLKQWDGVFRAWLPCRLAIDLKTRRPHHSGADAWFFSRGGRLEEDIGIILLSLPVTLPLAPILVAANCLYGAGERHSGMSRHSRSLLRALRGQLDAETEALLVEALQNDWQDRLAEERRWSRQSEASD